MAIIEECEWIITFLFLVDLKYFLEKSKLVSPLYSYHSTSVSLLSSKLGQSIQPDKVAEPDKARGNDRFRIHLLLR